VVIESNMWLPAFEDSSYDPRQRKWFSKLWWYLPMLKWLQDSQNASIGIQEAFMKPESLVTGGDKENVPQSLASNE
jgi:hypothetical protein